MKISKVFFASISALALVFVFCAVIPALAQTTTTNCLALATESAQISCLTDLVTQLTAELTQLMAQQGTTAQPWCHTFTKPLGTANSGDSEVGQLHTALQNQNISFAPDTGNIYSAGTTFGVCQFQTKYSAQILTPSGLTACTGYVGNATIAQLNLLYGCAQTSVSPSTAQVSPAAVTPTSMSPADSTGTEPPGTVPPGTITCNEFGCTTSGVVYYCTDYGDSGLDYYNKGDTRKWDMDVGVDYNDYCLGGYSNLLNEFYCVGNKVESIQYACPAGCTDGACNQGASAISSPAAGENVQGGTTYKIQWVPGPSTSSFSIMLAYPYDANSSRTVEGYKIGTAPASQGYYLWNVPDNIAGQHRIELYPNDGVGAPNFSGPFTLWAVAKCTDSDATPAYPTGLNYLTKGTASSIDSSAKTDTETDYCSDPTSAWPSTLNEYYCNGNVINVKQYTCPPGNTKSCVNGACIQQQVAQPAEDVLIQVVSPSGNEQWAQGTTQNITWKEQNISGKALYNNLYVAIGIEGSDGQIAWLGSVLTNLGSFSWKVGYYLGGAGSVLPVGKYKIRIADADYPGVYGESDGTFSIVAPAIPPCVGICPICTDSDNGKDYYTKGTTYGQTYAGEPDPETRTDSCVTHVGDPSSYVREYFCNTDGNTIGNTDYLCVNGCTDGVCNKIAVSTPTPTPTPISTPTPTPTSTPTPTPTPSPTPTIQSQVRVLSPNGAEQLVQGNTYNITWQANGLDTVGISIINYDGGYQTTVATSVSASNGFYSWTVPANVINDNKYKLEIYDPHNPTATNDYSDNYFSIVAAPAPQPYVKVVSPNGGETFDAGAQINVSWDFGNLPSTQYQSFMISLLDYTYSSSSPTDEEDLALPDLTVIGEKNQIFPLMDFISGSKFKIKLTFVAGGATYTDVSDGYFSVAQPVGQDPVTVTWPNGGEQLTIGVSYNITWQTSSDLSGDKVNIYAVNPSVAIKKLIVSSVSASDGTYTWKAGGLSSYQTYKIQIDAVNSSGAIAASDTSDNYFNIVTESTSPSYTVVSPNGGETFQKGQNITVQWSTVAGWVAAGATCNPLQFTLLDYTSPQTPNTYILGQTTSDASGSYVSVIPNTNALFPGSKFKVEVSMHCTASGRDYNYQDFSDNYFTITGPTSANISASSLASISDALANIAAELQLLLKK